MGEMCGCGEEEWEETLNKPRTTTPTLRIRPCRHALRYHGNLLTDCKYGHIQPLYICTSASMRLRLVPCHLASMLDNYQPADMVPMKEATRPAGSRTDDMSLVEPGKASI